MPYHVRVTPKSDTSHVEVRLDLSEADLEQRFLRPYREGQPLVIAGKTIRMDEVERIEIHYTEESSDVLIPRVKAEHERQQRESGVVYLSSHGYDYYAAGKGRDVTDELITGPPGSATPRDNDSLGSHVKEQVPSDPHSVFVVHGRDLGARDAVFTFLRSVGLRPIEWIQALRASDKPAPYVSEVLTAAFSLAQAVVVLLTPDDEGRLRKELQQLGDPPHETELSGQARLNVIFEAGMAMGRAPDRVVLIEMGELRPFSDIGGYHVVRLDNTTQRRQELATKLTAAGCPVDLTGTDWHTAGDFSIISNDRSL